MENTPAKRTYQSWNSKGQNFSSSASRSTGPAFQTSSNATPYLPTSTSGENVFSKRLRVTSSSSAAAAAVPVKDNNTCSTENEYSENCRHNRQKGPEVSKSSSDRNLSSSSNRDRNETVSNPGRRFQGSSSRAPFSRETPCFNQETPIILATAKHIGSEIHTSCNTESISRLQNPYSDCVSSTSSEYFTKKRSATTPKSSSFTTGSSRSRSLETSSRQQDAETMNDSDLGHLRSTTVLDGSSLNESQVK